MGVDHLMDGFAEIHFVVFPFTVAQQQILWPQLQQMWRCRGKTGEKGFANNDSINVECFSSFFNDVRRQYRNIYCLSRDMISSYMLGVEAAPESKETNDQNLLKVLFFDKKKTSRSAFQVQTCLLLFNERLMKLEKHLGIENDQSAELSQNMATNENTSQELSQPKKKGRR